MLMTIDRKAKNAIEALRIALDRSPAARQLCKSKPGLEHREPQRVIQLAVQDRETVLSPEEELIVVGYLRDRGVHSASTERDLRLDEKTERMVKTTLFKVKRRK